MMTQNLAALVRYRIEQADEALTAARILLREGSLRASFLAAIREECRRLIDSV